MEGTSASFRYGTKLRKVYGHGGISVTHSLDLQNINDPQNFQIKVSGAELQSSIAMKRPMITAQAPLPKSLVSGLEQALEELSQSAPSGGTIDTSGLLPNTGPATFTGNLQVGSLQTGNCTVSGALRVQDIDVLALAQGKQTQLTQTSQLTVARVTAGGATPSEATASAFTDLEALDLMVNSIRGRPGGDLVLEGASSGPVLRIPPAGGASIAGRLTSTGGVFIEGGGVLTAQVQLCG